MEQLIMRWKNDGEPLKELSYPKGVTVKNWNETENALDKWLDIVQYGLTEKKEDEEFYKKCNYHFEYYKPETCYFFLLDGKEVATVTLICNPRTKEGYVHMVATKTEARGKGIGNLMSFFAVDVFKKNKMETAHLTTDAFRIPAIKSYLKSGFYPDLSTEDFKQRWDEVFRILENKK